MGVSRPARTVVEYTGGSTGVSLALVCAVKAYPLRIVTSDAFARGEAGLHDHARRRACTSCEATTAG